MTGSDDQVRAELAAQAAAHIAPGGPVDAVRTFLELLDEGDLNGATELVDAAALEGVPGGLAAMDFSFLKEPGWGISGRPRPEGLNSETVLFAFTGTDEVRIYDGPTEVQGYAFVVRRDEGGWQITRFDQG